MKTLTLSALLCVVLFSLSSFSTSSASPALAVYSSVQGFDHFRVHRQGSNAALSWAISAPGIQQFRIERSYDGEFYDPISTVESNGNAVHRFNDTDVFPGIIYYKIVAVYADGSEESSSVESVRIVRRK